MVDEKIKTMLANHLGIERELIKDESQIINDLGADSLDIVELVIAFEDAFEIEIEDVEYQDKTTVGAIVKLVESKLS